MDSEDALWVFSCFSLLFSMFTFFSSFQWPFTLLHFHSFYPLSLFHFSLCPFLSMSFPFLTLFSFSLSVFFCLTVFFQLILLRYFFLPHLTFYLLCLFQLFSLCVSLSVSISLPLCWCLFVRPLSHLTFYLKNINFLSSLTFGISQLMMRIWFNGLVPHY
jgi:hypothetical protein